MFARTLSIVIAVAAASDPCTVLHPNSTCQEDGFCGNIFLDMNQTLNTNSTLPTRPISCTDAYIRISGNLIRPTSEAPIIMPITATEWTEAVIMRSRVARSEGELVWTLTHPPALEFVELVTLVIQLFSQFESQFPRVIVDTALLSDLMVAAECVGTRVFTKTTPKATIEHYQEVFAHLISVRGIDAHLRATIDYIMALESVTMKAAVFANNLPIFHAWYRLHESLKLTIITVNYEFMSFSSQFAPVYLTDPRFVDWMIPVAPSVLAPIGPWPMLPTIPGIYEEDTFPLSVLNAMRPFETDEDDIETLIESSIEGINADLENRIVVSVVPLRWISFARATMFTLEYFPGIPRLELIARFCQKTTDTWIYMFSVLANQAGRHFDQRPLPELLPLFRLCGKNIIGLPHRVKDVLPSVVGVRDRAATTLIFPPISCRDPDWLSVATQFLNRIPIYKLRSGVRVKYGKFGSNIQRSHISFLHTFICAIVDESFEETEEYLQPIPGSSEERLRALGIAIALTLIEGDPRYTLSSLLGEGMIGNIFFGSELVKIGFAKVFNQPVFESLFDDSESLQLVNLIRSFTPLKSRTT